MAGCCIFCGEASVDESHFHSCSKYKESLAQNDSDDDHDSSPSTTTTKPDQSSVVGLVVVGAGAGAKRPFVPETPNGPEVVAAPKVTPAPTGGAMVTHNTAAAAATNKDGELPSKKPRGEYYESFVVCCITCGKQSCPYENRYTQQDQKEFDPSEPTPTTTFALTHVSFQTLNGPLKVIVGGLLKSTGFWSKHKFIGDPQLNFKIKTWMNNHLDPSLVDANWVPLRQAVKETLHYKRHRSLLLIKKAFFGESPVMATWLSIRPILASLLIFLLSC